MLGNHRPEPGVEAHHGCRPSSLQNPSKACASLGASLGKLQVRSYLAGPVVRLHSARSLYKVAEKHVLNGRTDLMLPLIFNRT